MKEKQFTNRSTTNFGPKLYSYITNNNIELEWLSEQLNVSVRTIKSWMSYNGVDKNGRFPKLESLLRLSKVLRRSIDSFLR